MPDSGAIQHLGGAHDADRHTTDTPPGVPDAPNGYCPDCFGTGVDVYWDICPTCKGRG